MNLELYKRLDSLIASENTGTLKDLAKKLDVSARHAKHMIDRMREEFDCPIVFNKRTKSYYYTEKGNCHFKFERSKIDLFLQQITDIAKQILTSILVLLVFS